MDNGKSIVDLLKGIEKTMGYVNEQMTIELMKEMTPEQLDLLAEARKASNKTELKKMTEKLVNLNSQMNNYGS
tara:strand:- start:4326 stop:4544 length:219 start_codon:yes stop_codon:yes gene_type:complete